MECGGKKNENDSSPEMTIVHCYGGFCLIYFCSTAKITTFARHNNNKCRVGYYAGAAFLILYLVRNE